VFVDQVRWAACEVAGLAAVIKRHPQGLAISDARRWPAAGADIGSRLGADPPMLDEPSSALAFSSAAQFKQSLQQFAIGKTMIIITHRASLLELADRLIGLADGVVVADGACDAVIAALQAGSIGRRHEGR
jgi:ATP-binding cassette subfamily C protein LapB